jgi:hypothetical protein
MSRRRKWAIGAVIVFVLLVLVGACAGDPEDDPPQGTAPTTSTEAAASPTTTEASDPFAEKRAEMRAAVANQEWDDAITLAAYIGDDDARNRYRRSAARRLVARARAAERAGRYSTATRLARRSRSDYGAKVSKGSADIIHRAEAALTRQRAARRAAAQAKAEARRVAREQRRAERAAKEAADEASEAADDYDAPDEDYDAPSSGGRAGCNPATARDGDGDGVVCE